MRRLCWIKVTPDGDIEAQAYEEGSRLSIKISGKRVEISEEINDTDLDKRVDEDEFVSDDPEKRTTGRNRR